MKKRQAFIAYSLILAFLGGYIGFYFSIHLSDNASSSDLSHFQKNTVSENISVLLAEEEVDNEESFVRKITTPLVYSFDSSTPLNLRFKKEHHYCTIPSKQQQKKFLLHLQLLI